MLHKGKTGDGGFRKLFCEKCTKKSGFFVQDDETTKSENSESENSKKVLSFFKTLCYNQKLAEFTTETTEKSVRSRGF